MGLRHPAPAAPAGVTRILSDPSRLRGAAAVDWLAHRSSVRRCHSPRRVRGSCGRTGAEGEDGPARRCDTPADLPVRTGTLRTVGGDPVTPAARFGDRNVVGLLGEYMEIEAADQLSPLTANAVRERRLGVCAHRRTLAELVSGGAPAAGDVLVTPWGPAPEGEPVPQPPTARRDR